MTGSHYQITTAVDTIIFVQLFSHHHSVNAKRICLWHAEPKQERQRICDVRREAREEDGVVRAPEKAAQRRAAGEPGARVLSCALFLTTLFLLETPYMGFNAFVTAGVLIVYAFSTVVLLNKSPSAYAIGYVVGSSLLVLGLTFEDALYWGLIAQDNGAREAASIVACALDGAIFIIQLAITVVIVQSKEDFIDTYAAYEYIPDGGFADRLSLSNSNVSPTNYQATVPTADI